MAQDIDLSPRMILSYMRDLEDRLPRRRYVEFDSSRIGKIRTEGELNSAARVMMDFVGLSGYVPQCNFAKTDEEVGGFTYAMRSDNVVPISVSERYRGNRDAVLAVLAHEICHKVVYLSGIDFMPPAEIFCEIYTDICTIYVGFGRLILEGCQTTKGTETFYLGYLKFPVYKNAYDIARQILMNDKNSWIEGDDSLLEESFEMWHSSDDKWDVYKRSFADMQDEYARLTRDIKLLKQVLEQVTESYAGILDKADEYYFRKGVNFDAKTNELRKPIGAFSAIYENVVSKADQERFQGYDDIVRDAMLSLIDKCNNVRVERLKYIPFECPFCHEVSAGRNFDGRKALIKCKSCGKHFYLDCEHLDFDKELGRGKKSWFNW